MHYIITLTSLWDKNPEKPTQDYDGVGFKNELKESYENEKLQQIN